MKISRKVQCIILSICLLLSTALPVFAATETELAASEPQATQSSIDAEDESSSETMELPEEGTYVEGEILVKVKSEARSLLKNELFSKYVREYNYLFSIEEEEDTIDSNNSAKDIWYHLILQKDADMQECCNALSNTDGVLAVEPNYIRTVQKTTEDVMDADPYIHAQTWLDRISAFDAWDSLAEGAAESSKKPGEGIIVAVVDTGVDKDHPDLMENLIAGYDFVDNDNDPDDEGGHGTHVAGIIAACYNNEGVCGVAYGAKIMPVRVLGSNGGTSENIALGIKYAADHGAKIINMSLGGFGRSNAEEDAVRYVRQKDCLVVAAAGNENLPTNLAEGQIYGGVYSEPANYPGVLTVMAAKEDGTLANFSNYDSDPGEGCEYEIIAPGVQILSTTYDGDYGYKEGTSMACPVVAGAAAVLMGMGCDAESTFQIIASCEKKPAGRVDYSYPSLDLNACVQKAKESPSYNTAPVVTNCSVKAALENQNFGYETVDFGGIDTSSRVYFYNGTLKSDLYISFENIGGSGDVTITGTVGGCDITSSTYHLSQGNGLSDSDSNSKLQISGTPSVNSEGNVEISLFTNDTIVFRDDLPAYELKTLSDSSFSFDSQEVQGENAFIATQTQENVTLSGAADMGIVWVIDAIVYIPAGKTLEICSYEGEKNCIIYCAEGTHFQIAYDDSNEPPAYGSLRCEAVELLGKNGVQIITEQEKETIELYRCSICDPYIRGIKFAGQNAFYNNGGENCLLKGNSIYISGFYNCSKLNVECNYFWGNMVDDCENASIIAHKQVFSNTFVENFNNEDADSVLTCWTSDYSEPDGEEPLGFYENCVIGPMNVCKLENEEKTEYLAEINRVYHQNIGEKDERGNDVLPTDTEDKVFCHSSSRITDDLNQMKDWGVNEKCPAFVTHQETLAYEKNVTNEEEIDYQQRFYFSTPVIAPNGVSLSSKTDPMTRTSKYKFSDDGSYCDVSGAMMLEESEINCYHLSGFYKESIKIGDETYYLWNTAMDYQSSYNYMLRYSDFADNLNLEKFEIESDKECNTLFLEWDDERLKAGYQAEIQCKMNDGEYVPVQNVQFTSEKSCTLDITDIPGDNLLTYQVRLTKQGEKTFCGEKDFFISVPDKYMGVELIPGTVTSESGDTLSVALKAKVRIKKCMSFWFPGLHASAVTFGDEVKKHAKIVYGAAANAKGTMVYMDSKEYDILFGEKTLFTMTIPAYDGKTKVCVKNGTEYLNGSFCESSSGGGSTDTIDPMTDLSIPEELLEEVVLEFADVSEDFWAYESISEAVKENLVLGYEDGDFRPNNDVSRAEFVTMLWRMAGTPAATMTASFKDVMSDAWYAPQISWAAEKGYVKGESADCFDPDGDITRQEAMTIFYRYNGKSSGAEAAFAAMYDTQFEDSGSIAEWAKPAMYWAVHEGLLTGETPKLLNPSGNATRAQIATVFVRYANKYQL